jgi:hypothetical protein
MGGGLALAFGVALCALVAWWSGGESAPKTATLGVPASAAAVRTMPRAPRPEPLTLHAAVLAGR